MCSSLFFLLCFSFGVSGVSAQAESEMKSLQMPEFADLIDLSFSGLGQAPTHRLNRRPEKVISGLLIRYGTGSSNDINANWLVSLGGDFGIVRNVAIGFEIMPSIFRVEEESASFKHTGIPFNAFINLKGGLHFGGLIPFLKFLKIFAGAGGGVGGQYSFISYFGDNVQKIIFDPAVHLLGGIELDFGVIGLVAEFQKIKIMASHQNPDPWVNYFIFGLRLF
jgi:hypothetical protein